MPRWPTQAVQGPLTGVQHSPVFAQARRAPVVAVRRCVTTVTSWVAEPVSASWLASVGGQAAAMDA